MSDEPMTLEKLRELKQELTEAERAESAASVRSSRLYREYEDAKAEIHDANKRRREALSRYEEAGKQFLRELRVST